MAKAPSKKSSSRALSYSKRPAGSAKLPATAPPRATHTEAAPSAGKPNRPPTAFEARLYAVCKCIPAGRVTTYGAMAEVLGSAARACGQALRRNPFAPEVPCHRVIAASLELGGFSGSWGVGCANVQKKRRLLAEEGVLFDEDGRLQSTSAVMAAAELKQAAANVL